ncbi:unnamed protein product [Miscanthus lutarioriparius]|uniref:Uncharacterized protein n=1 Tax=Miscanthus lutarioriparius TaxID=422564 RepID=A0A811RFK4_9POAL|nr:unnamed protein product [Miscanthus lutarioriparius]
MAVALAALFVVRSCGNELTLTIGKDSSSTKLSLITNIAISEVSVKPKGATDFSDDLKESPPTPLPSTARSRSRDLSPSLHCEGWWLPCCR